MIRQRMRELWRSEDGPTAIEYALVASLISVAILVSLVLLGGKVSNNYDHMSAEVVNAAN